MIISYRLKVVTLTELTCYLQEHNCVVYASLPTLFQIRYQPVMKCRRIITVEHTV